jgi:four helix bundle protein
VHKLGIVRKELHESYVWLRLLQEAGIGEAKGLEPIVKECDEFCRMISESWRTAAVNAGRMKKA